MTNANLVSSISEPISPELWPQVGRISSDKVATIGLNNFAFLFQGSNQYYDAYAAQRTHERAAQWAELTDARHSQFAASGTQFLSVFVPNKATSLNELYPFLLHTRETPHWTTLKQILRNNSGVLYFDEPEAEFSGRRWTSTTFWQRVGSHWTTVGCLAAVNRILLRLGLDELDPPIVEADIEFWGDLSSRWSSTQIRERVHLAIPDGVPLPGLPEPNVSFDSGVVQAKVPGVVGRRVTWQNPEARYPARISIIGNSFSGPGERPEHIAWWMSRLFKHVTFIHSNDIPSDLMELERPDVVIFQGLERFFNIVPNDKRSIADLDRAYASEVRG